MNETKNPISRRDGLTLALASLALSPSAKRPKTQLGLAGVLLARLLARALGSGGFESARHLLILSRIAFGICIK